MATWASDDGKRDLASPPEEAVFPLAVPLEAAWDPEEVWLRWSELPHVVFFDSSDRTSAQARYSFVAADPFAWFEADFATPHVWQTFHHRLAEFSTPSRANLPPFQGGAAGLIGYEMGTLGEPIGRAAYDDLPTPPLALGFYDVVAAFDHQTGQQWLISQGFPETDVAARCERAEARLTHFRERLHTPLERLVENSSKAPNSVKRRDELAPQYPVESADLTSTFNADAYRHTIRQGVELIRAGELFQVNLAQRLLAPAREDSRRLYQRLRRRNPAPYAGYLDLGDAQVCSASPECFLTLRDRWAETRPIKGTRGRSAHPEADLFAGDALRSSQKDRAENIMITDLMRNDFARVCAPDSVQVVQLCGLETYAYVKHLVSVVRGQLRHDQSLVDLWRACFPAGSITGAPKIRAMQAIATLEPTARGPYCGALAYFGFDGQMDASVLIRTITATCGWWQLPVGGGIVAQSDPDDEYRETWHKARGLLAALRP